MGLLEGGGGLDFGGIVFGLGNERKGGKIMRRGSVKYLDLFLRRMRR